MANQRKTIDLSVFQGEARRVRVVIKTPVLGELTTRTNSSNCVITYESGSIIPTVGESYELRWSGGRRQRMTAASATGQAVTFTGGTGSPLPATGESISITGFTEPKNIAGWDAQCLVRTKAGTVVGTFEVGASEDADGGPITIADASGLIDLVFNETWTTAADDGFLRYDLLVTPDDRRPFFPFGGNLHLQVRGNSSPAFDSDAEVTVNLDQDVVIEFSEGLPGESGTGGGGSGTVTSVSVVTANGVSGTVANASTTPAITVTLGAITPTTVRGLTITTTTGTLTITNGKTFSVSNTLTLAGTDGSTLNIGGGGTLGSAAYTSSSAYEVPLTFSTGLTRSTNTITVNTSQNISTLSNLTSNGLVTTSGGTGALSVTTLGSGVAAFLSTPSVANFFSALTGETGPWRGLATATSLGAISFARTNADDSVTMLSVSGLLDEIGMSSTNDVSFSTVNAEAGLSAGTGGFNVDVSGNCTAASFAGPLTGNASTATLASTVTTAAETSDTTCFVAFTNASGAGSQAIKLNTSLTFNASTGALGATSFVGNTSASTITGTTLASNVVSSSLTSLGTIATGVWQGTIIATAYGGTGVDNSTGGTANTFWARPNGATGAATYRAIVAADIPTLNQNTTGSAATLTTARAIYGNNFDGSAALTQVIASTYGGTGNGFTKFTGPATAERTFTLPNSDATLLYSGGALGTPASGTLTNCTGTASGLTAGTVTTNANLTGPVTSVGNATSIICGTSVSIPGSVTDQTVVLIAKSPFAGTINAANGVDLGAGTLTLAIKINGTNVTGLGSISASTTGQDVNATAANTFSIGDRITAVISSASGATDLEFTLKYTR